jgi:hypothetical protein
MKVMGTKSSAKTLGRCNSSARPIQNLKESILKTTILSILIFLVSLLVAGCSPGTAPPATTPTPLPVVVADQPATPTVESDPSSNDIASEPTTETPPIADNPPIEEEAAVDSIILGIEGLFPVKARVTVGGQLPDSCVEISSWEQNLNGNILFVRPIITALDGATCSNSLVRFEQEIDLDVKGLSAGELSSGDYFLDANGFTMHLSPSFASSLLDEDLSRCPVGDDSQLLYFDEDAKFCLLYPDTFTMRNDEAPDVVSFYGPPLDEHTLSPLQAMLFISHQEPAQGRTLDQIAAEHQANYTDTDRELIISPAFLDGQQAIQIEGEGEMAKSLQVITLHEDRVFTLSVVPYGDFPKAADDVALVWDLALNSFTFIRPPVSQEEGQTISLTEFEDLLIEAISTHNYDWIQQLMDETFGFAFWRSEGYEATPEEAIEQLHLNYLQPDQTITFEDTLPDLSASLGGNSDILSIWNPATNPIGAIFSTGWGPDGGGEAFLIVTESADGILAWDGIVLAGGEMGGFAGPEVGGG